MAQATRRRMPKRSREQTRALMLRAATELVCEGVSDPGDPGVSAVLAYVQLTEVAARATAIVRAELADALGAEITPITTGAIYQVWPNQSDFQADLLFHLAELDAASGPGIGEVEQIVREAVAAATPLPEVIAAMIEQSFRHTRDSAVFYATLSLYPRCGNARVREALGHGDERFADAIRPVWQMLLDGYRLRMRAPYTVEELAVSVGAILEGCALQWRRKPEWTADPLGDPDVSLPTRLAQMVFAQMTEMTDIS